MPDSQERPEAAAAATQQRCGFVAVIGAPNAGKSTLVNAMVGAKVSIVSHKVQTTRAPVRGIAIEGSSQLVFIDTPGIFRPKRRLDRAMVDAAWGGAHDADIVVLLVDAAKGIEEDLERILDKLAGAPHSKILALNKVDRVADKDRLLPLIAKLSEKHAFDRVFLISALDGNGVADLKRYLAERMPVGPWHYPEDEISDAPLRLLAAELTREKIYEYLHEELPYSTTVETTDWKTFKNGSVRIEQTIYVERDSQKSIVLGKGGQTIKKISSQSRGELAKIIEHDVHLFLFVKVRENWGSDPERYREMGLDFPKD
jgi:GTP-binding protein Era